MPTTPSVYAPLSNSPVHIFTDSSSVSLETPPLSPLIKNEYGINNQHIRIRNIHNINDD